jgi:hypothetical protein
MIATGISGICKIMGVDPLPNWQPKQIEVYQSSRLTEGDDEMTTIIQ